ncbi:MULTISPECIES: ABC transporter permease [Thermocrispum]|jgi:ABC-2 type transport system permease protein|uniref:ABC transporter permease n=1 Tax=Thermocrispum agreste TaxID=37925 RepID=A0A2W4JXE3_9PSEU|nr:MULTISPECIES: ABC transporter permease [Thermocrispum]PZM98527.1 MAG: ABC transporter permease [Thermocrispum agreste]
MRELARSHTEVAPATAVRLVAQREIDTRLRTRSFVMSTAVIIAVLAGYLLLQASLFSDAHRVDVGLTGQATSIAGPLQVAGKAVGLEVHTTQVGDRTAARAKLEADELDAVVFGNPAEPEVLVRSELDDRLRAVLIDIARQQILTGELAKAGVTDPRAVLAQASQADVEVTTVAPAGAEHGQRLGIGLIMVFLLFMAISTYGTMVAQGVVEEKASRVVEILLATVQPWQLLLGKVVGIGLVGLAQLVIVAGVGLVMAVASGVVTLSGVAIGALIWGVVWYVVGFFLYATLFAAAGSLVSRQEDVQSVVTPVTIVLTLGFVVGLNLMLQNPDGTGVAALSHVPLLSPVIMPGRITAGQVAGWEIALSLIVTLAAVVALTWLGGRVYHNAVLHTGSRMRVRDALRGTR